MDRLAVAWVTARCAAIVLEDGGLYATIRPYRLTINGADGGQANRVVTLLHGLLPDTAYHIRVETLDGEAVGECAFTTPHEYVTLDVRAFGAKGDGAADDTAAVQAAMLSCPQDGRVLLANGDFRVTHLFVKSGLRLEIARDARLCGIPDRAKIPVLPGMVDSTDELSEYNLGSWEGNPLPMYASLITGVGARHVEIYGEGVLDGMASPDNWWKDPKRLHGAWRPRMAFFNRCEGVVMAGLRVRNSPSWNVHPYFSRDVRMIGLEIISPADSPNTDGINPESCENVEILGVRLSVGDDCVALKAGKRYMGDTYATPCRHVRVAHCEMGDGHGAVTLGSELSGGIQDVLVESCVFHDTDRGLRVKTRRGRGRNAIVDGIAFRNIHMRGVKTPFTVNCFYRCDPDGDAEHVQDRSPAPLREDTPEVRALRFEGIRCEDCEVAAAYFLGLPERPIAKIEMKNVSITFAKKARAGVAVMTRGAEQCRKCGIVAVNVTALQMERVEVSGFEGERVRCNEM